jgi:GNAT superfamily N-acetyltransferase
LCGQAASRIGATVSTSGAAPGYIARMKLRLLTPGENLLAARIIASGMVDDPIQRSIHGPDVSARLRGMEHAFGATLRETERPTLGAWKDGELLGTATYGPPGSCPLPEERREALSQAVADLPLSARKNFHAWRANWGAHDPAEPHWHLGPLAVRADAQARGIGSRLLKAFLELVDKHEGTAYLETDTARNVRFYERFGFTAGRDEVLGVECTFMSRRPTVSQP